MYKRFEELCKERGVTPYKVAKETGITTATLSNWKAGRYTPKIDKMSKIAKFFDVSYSYLMGRSDDRTRKEIVIDLSDVADKAASNFIKENATVIDVVEMPTDDETKKALELYELYKKANPQIQSAIETLLKSPPQDS